MNVLSLLVCGSIFNIMCSATASVVNFGHGVCIAVITLEKFWQQWTVVDK